MELFFQNAVQLHYIARNSQPTIITCRVVNDKHNRPTENSAQMENIQFLKISFSVLGVQSFG